MRMNIPRIDPARLGSTLESFKNGAVYPLQKLFELCASLFNNGITIGDNMQAAIVMLPLVHGVEYQFANPLRGVPKFFTDADSVLGDGSAALGVQSYKLNRQPRDASGAIRSGYLGITVQFALPVGEQMTLLRTTNTGNFTTGVEATMAWDGVCTAEGDNAGDVFALSGTTGVLVGKPGLYLIRAHASWNINGVGTRTSYVNIDGTRTLATEVPNAGAAFFTQIDAAGSVGLGKTASATITMSGVQTSGGNLAQIGAGALSDRAGFGNRAFLQVTRLKNLEPYSANVTGILWGG